MSMSVAVFIGMGAVLLYGAIAVALAFRSVRRRKPGPGAGVGTVRHA